MKTELVTASTGTPITLDEVKDWVRLERGYTDEDDILRAIRDAAVGRTERYTGRKFITAIYYAYFDMWPGRHQHHTHEHLHRGSFITQSNMNVSYLNFNAADRTDSIVLPFPPLQGLNSTSTGIVMFDENNTTGVVSSSLYLQDTVSEPGRVVLDFTESWPTTALHNKNPIRVEFKVGYGDESSDVPQQLRTAALMLVGDMYENRENFIIGQGQTVVKLPFAFEHLARPYKSWTGAI